MKNHCFFLMILIAFSACKKDKTDNDKYYTDLHDTLISVQWAGGGKDYNLDIDKDGTNDLIITDYSHYSSYSGSESYIKISPVSGYKICFSDCISQTWQWNPTMEDTLFRIDTLMIPKVFTYGDTLILNDDYTQNPLMIRYYFHQTGMYAEYSSDIKYGIEYYTDYYYMAFIETDSNSHRMAWVKVKFPSNFEGIVINSCRYSDNADYLIIE